MKSQNVKLDVQIVTEKDTQKKRIGIVTSDLNWSIERNTLSVKIRIKVAYGK
jgi:hypothetical protein